MSNAPSKPVSFSRPKVGYFSNRPRICHVSSLRQELMFRTLYRWAAYFKGLNKVHVLEFVHLYSKFCGGK